MGHGCHDPSSVFFPLELSHSHPLLPLGFVSNFAEYSCLIVGRCMQCYFAFWLTFYWSSFNLQGYFLHEKIGLYKKIVFVKNCATIRCPSTIYPTINPYRVSGRNMASFGGLFGVVLRHGCHDPSSVLFSFKLSHSHPLLPLCFVSNFAEYSCLIVGRCLL